MIRYSDLLSISSPSDVEEEFLQYQLLERNEISEDVWKAALVVNDCNDGIQYYRMDVVWNYLRSLRNPNGIYRFQKLSQVALLVLILPHSNAEEERVFSMINKNKTKFRPSLKLDGTLSSIITIKLANEMPCYLYEPEESVLETAKKATMEYNKAHSCK